MNARTYGLGRLPPAALLLAAVLLRPPSAPAATDAGSVADDTEARDAADPSADSLGFLNLDFESPGYPREWYTGGAGYAVELDSVTAYSGRQSLRLRYLRPGRLAVVTLTVPGPALAGRRLRISAYVRSESVLSGWAGLWCRVDGPDRMLTWQTSRERAARGTTPWRRQEIEVAIDSSAVEVHFGARHSGDGVAWFDRFELTVDGVPFREPPEPVRRDPDARELEWIRSHAVPLVDDDPERDCADLVPVLRRLGNARVVGLGEGTHGTLEFSRMKHRLFRCMVEELGFTLFAMECNLTEAERLDRYVLTGEGDPAALLRSMGFWTWNTQEVLDLLRWMRAHNATARVPVRFLGFDMLGAAAPMDSLVLFAHRSDPDGFPAVSESLRVVALTHELERRGPVGTAGAFLRGDPLVEKRLRLHGWIRTEAIENGEAALWIRADVDSGRAAFAGMEGAGPAGTSGWSRYAVELVVPPRARRIAFGALLRGEGAAWFDSLGLDVDGRATRPGSLYDFGFEDARPLGGLRLSGLGYRADADTSGARFGRKSLRLRQDPVTVAGDRSIRWTRAIGAARSVLARLEAESLALVARAPDGDVARALGEARLVLQSCEAGRNPPVRDRAMADNVAWLLEHAPEGARIALWAHNAHVSRRPGAMGSHLARRYGADYTNIALAFHQGTYTASDIGGPHAYDAVPSRPGSLEWALHRSGIPILALDLRDASPADSASAWLTGTPEFRSIGALPVGHGFYRTPVAREFDAVLFFDRAGASRLLPREGSP